MRWEKKTLLFGIVEKKNTFVLKITFDALFESCSAKKWRTDYFEVKESKKHTLDRHRSRNSPEFRPVSVFRAL